MPKSCRAPHCSNAAGQARGPGRRLSFYKFPLQDAARLRQWLVQMRQEHWVPTRHQHLCSDHFEPSCFEYRWGVRYLRPDAVPTIFPGPDTPPKRLSPGKPPRAPQPEQPPPDTPTASPPPGRPPAPDPTLQEAVPVPFHPTVEPAPSSVPGGPEEPPPVLAYVETIPEPFVAPPQPPPHAGGAELSAAELLGVVLLLQRKVKVLQQRHRRHCARLEAMEGLLQHLRPPETARLLQEACLPPDPPGAVTIICGEAEDALLYALPPPGISGTALPPPGMLGTSGTLGTSGDLGPQQP